MPLIFQQKEAGRHIIIKTTEDPFGGAGTTGLVADRLSRDAVLIELSPAYARMARERIIRPLPLLGSLVSLETLGEGG